MNNTNLSNPPNTFSSAGVAIFDLDYTLINADCELMWTKFLYAKGVVDRSFVERIESYYRDYEQGKLDILAYERYLFKPLIAQPFSWLNRLRDEYLNLLGAFIRPDLLERLAWHRSQKHTLILATASNNLIAVPIAEIFHIPNLISTRFDLHGDTFSGKLIDIPAYLDGKAQLLNRWLEQNQMNLDLSWGYSDSFHDLPFLSRVKYPVAVYPDAGLRSHALGHHWEIIEG